MLHDSGFGNDDLDMTPKQGNKSKKQTNVAMNFKMYVFFFFFVFSRAALAAGSQARGPIRAIAAGLHHRDSKTRSELHLQPTPQPTAMPDP